uniref:Uncharacterized protein n=1 Tax=Oryza nivara TaxID=4536 RepID=A0A0E0HNV1_ORYNI
MVTRLSRTTLLAFRGTNEATFRHAARARRRAVVQGAAGGSSGSGAADSRIPGGTDFHLPLSSAAFFFFVFDGSGGDRLESFDGEPELEAAAKGARRRRRLVGEGAAAGRRRGRERRGGASRRDGRHGRGGFGSFERNISPVGKVLEGWRPRPAAGKKAASWRRRAAYDWPLSQIGPIWTMEWIKIPLTLGVKVRDEQYHDFEKKEGSRRNLQLGARLLKQVVNEVYNSKLGWRGGERV